VQNVPRPAPSDIKVQILNGCGVRGLASRTRGVLRSNGYDVMGFGNSQNNYDKSTVIARQNTPEGLESAKSVAEFLGIHERQLSTEVVPNRVDITVTLIVGADYRSLNLNSE